MAPHKAWFVVLEAGSDLGHSWRNRWDSLKLFTPVQYDGLPGMPFPAPADTYPTKDQVEPAVSGTCAANTDLRRRWLLMSFRTRTGYKLGGWAGAALLGLMILVTGCSSDSGSTAAGSASSTLPT
jgi:cation diffusion facilitator CzcD-associated flavoprotein CzcO